MRGKSLARLLVLLAFPTLAAAVDAVTEMSMSGVPFARIEFLDEHQVRACNAYSKLGLTEQDLLDRSLLGDPEIVPAEKRVKVGEGETARIVMAREMP